MNPLCGKLHILRRGIFGESVNPGLLCGPKSDPEGITDNSPAFQCRERSDDGQFSPEKGRLSRAAQ